MNELKQEFEHLLNEDKTRLAGIKRTIQQLTLFRLASFVGIILSLIYLSHPLQIAVSLVFMVLFFYGVKSFIQKEKEKKLYRRLIKINEDELLALDEIYTQFDGGTEFVNPLHAYSFDLDIFGEGSLFQFLNRTSTQLGKKQLATFLTQPLTEASQLNDRSKALTELAGMVRWRQLFAAKGQTHDEQDFKLLQLLSMHETLPKRETVKWLIRLLPILTLITGLLAIFSILPWGYLLIPVMVNIVILTLFGKAIKNFYRNFGNQSKILDNYREILFHIEQTEFKSELLNGLKHQLSGHNKPASVIVEQLQRAMSRFDYRANILFTLIAEPLFLWDLQCVYQLDSWHRSYHTKISSWFDVIAHFDALSSLANVNHTHPEWVEPEFPDQDFQLAATSLAHPLIKSVKRIGNEFWMEGKGKISIITGANMAGKSTFLRTMGINMILAMNGCRVCANRFSMKPIGLYTNMRTTDNLQKDESYFFAELLRLQQMLELIKKGNPLFIIVDEMLKGTNSTDKLNGSKALVEQLIQLNANGLIATHDLKLTELTSDFPEQIINQCFDVQFTDDNLVFDYKLHPGVTSTMNATFLMKKMGIIS